MSTLNTTFALHTQVVWSTSDEGIAQEIQRAAINGWQWDGKIHWRHTVESKVCVAVLLSVTAQRVAPDNPRVVLHKQFGEAA